MHLYLISSFNQLGRQKNTFALSPSSLSFYFVVIWSWWTDIFSPISKHFEAFINILFIFQSSNQKEICKNLIFRNLNEYCLSHTKIFIGLKRYFSSKVNFSNIRIVCWKIKFTVHKTIDFNGKNSSILQLLIGYFANTCVFITFFKALLIIISRWIDRNIWFFKGIVKWRLSNYV